MKKINPIILIVDDDPNDLLFMKAAFKEIGVVSDLRTVNSGHQAVAYLAGTGPYADRSLYGYPDFIITDLKMPGIDGFDLLIHLKLNPNTATIPTAVISGSQDEDDIQKCYLLGASSYHLKPSGLGELRALVKTLHSYWMICEVPAVDRARKRTLGETSYKMGPTFSPFPPHVAPGVEEMISPVGQGM